MQKENAERVLSPKIHPTVFIAEGARIFGDVEIKKGTSIWFNAVIRGDEGKVTIGENTNIQDNVVLHSDDGVAVEIGDNVTIGHGAVVRGAVIENDASVGMNATIMSHAKIGRNSIVGANTFVAYHKTFPERSLIMGIPGRLVRSLTEDEDDLNQIPVNIYLGLVEKYRSGKIRGVSGIRI